MLTTKEDVIDWLMSMEIKHYTIEDNLVVHVHENVNLRNKQLTEFPVQFGIVEGDFICTDNYLKSLKGSPRIVKGLFNCGNNDLTSLEGGPEEVMYYDCHINNLTSLKFVASQLETLDCSGNEITSLEYLPYVKTLDISCNKLTSLLGCPKEFKGAFNCAGNQLTSLEYGPIKVEYSYSCQDNPIEEFPYGDLTIGDLFICSQHEEQRIPFFTPYYTKEMLMLPSDALELFKLKKELDNKLSMNKKEENRPKI